MPTIMHLRKLVRFVAVLNYLMKEAEDGPRSVELHLSVLNHCLFTFKRSVHERGKKVIY